MNIESFLAAYIAAALWSSCDDEGEPLDDDYGPDDIAPETLAKMRADCAAFIAENAADLAAYVAKLGPAELTGEERAGCDFWLTRCGHGAGFWDRGIDALGDRLTAAASAFGNVGMYVGDDGKVHA